MSFVLITLFQVVLFQTIFTFSNGVDAFCIYVLILKVEIAEVKFHVSSSFFHINFVILPLFATFHLYRYICREMCFAILRLFLYLIFFFRALFCTRDIYFTGRDQLERYYEDFGFGFMQKLCYLI